MKINIPSERILLTREKRIKAIQKLYSYIQKITPYNPDMEGYITEDWLKNEKYITGGTSQTLTNNEKKKARDNIEAASKADVLTEIVTTTDSSLSAEVGKYYTLSNVGTLAITLPTIDAGTTNVQTVTFYIAAGSTPAVTITSADSKDVYYQDGFEIKAGNTYEINALFNGAAWIVAGVKIVVPVVEEEGGE